MAQADYGHTVRVHYSARLHDGTVLSSTFQGEPLEFTIGGDRVMRDFEDAIIGMNVGEAKNIAISGERMFGPHSENNLLEVDRKTFPEASLKIGKRVKVRGRRFSAKVVQISESKVLLDTNHPLCGKELFIDIYLMAIV